jgi:3-oxoacyl-[acyl-carrier protein] reductase
MSQNLQGKVAIVTGGSKGIGASIVKELSRRGAKVVINYSSSEDLASALASSIKEQGGEAITVQANIGSVEGPKKVVDAAITAYGKIDIVVNNAAAMQLRPVTAMQVEDIKDQCNLGIRGPLLLVKESAAYLQEHGRIINISSIVARCGIPHSSVFAATKGALESMSRVWASEFADKNITSNCVSPGPTATEKAAHLIGEQKAKLQSIVEQNLFKRRATMEEIATVVAFLAGPDSQWVTGDVIQANGGHIYN